MPTEFLAPPWWLIPGQEPQNTQPDTPELGAQYKPVWHPTRPLREISSESNTIGSGGYAVRFVDKSRFEADALGYTVYVPGQNFLQRRLPLYHGDSNDVTLTLRLLRELEHYDPSGEGRKTLTEDDGPHSAGWAAMGATLYGANYIQRPYELHEDEDVSEEPVPELKRYVTRFPEIEFYHRRVASWRFVFASDTTKPAPVLGSLPEYVQRWVYVWYQIPWDYTTGGAVPVGRMNYTGGCVNQYIFDPDLELEKPDGTTVTGFPAETLLYENYKLMGPYRQADGNFAVNVMNSFLWNYRGWQKAYNAASGGAEISDRYEAVHEQGFPTRPPFQKRNFDRLFMPKGAP